MATGGIITTLWHMRQGQLGNGAACFADSKAGHTGFCVQSRADYPPIRESLCHLPDANPSLRLSAGTANDFNVAIERLQEA